MRHDLSSKLSYHTCHQPPLGISEGSSVRWETLCRDGSFISFGIGLITGGGGILYEYEVATLVYKHLDRLGLTTSRSSFTMRLISVVVLIQRTGLDRCTLLKMLLDPLPHCNGFFRVGNSTTWIWTLLPPTFLVCLCSIIVKTIASQLQCWTAAFTRRIPNYFDLKLFAESPPVCLGCYAFIDCSTSCTICGWPVCDSSCEVVPAHKDAECAIFAAAKVKFTPVEDPYASCMQYECITPLR